MATENDFSVKHEPVLIIDPYSDEGWVVENYGANVRACKTMFRILTNMFDDDIFRIHRPELHGDESAPSDGGIRLYKCRGWHGWREISAGWFVDVPNTGDAAISFSLKTTDKSTTDVADRIYFELRRVID